MSGVFISYRRGDRPGYAARLTEALERRFGADLVFRDVEDITPGSDFSEEIRRRLDEVDVVLAVIGPAWLQSGADGTNRLDDPADFVRLEILSAIETGKPVWPVLVNGAQLPNASDLPQALQPLLRRQAIVLTDAGWHGEIDRLTDALKPIIRTPRQRTRHRLVLASFALITAGALGAWSLGFRSRAPSRGGGPGGHWSAEVTYDWGDTHRERFDLQIEGNALRGSASYLGTPRLIEEGEFSRGEIRFMTRSETMAGGELREITHRYFGRIENEQLRLRLESVGGFGSRKAVDIVATRTPAPATRQSD